MSDNGKVFRVRNIDKLIGISIAKEIVKQEINKLKNKSEPCEI